MNKPDLFDSHERMGLAFKSYDKVSKATIAKEIADNYLKDNGYLSSIITENELRIIKDFLAGKHEIDDLDDIRRVHKLEKKCLIYDDGMEDKYYIYDEFI